MNGTLPILFKESKLKNINFSRCEDKSSNELKTSWSKTFKQRSAVNARAQIMQSQILPVSPRVRRNISAACKQMQEDVGCQQSIFITNKRKQYLKSSPEPNKPVIKVLP